MLRVSFDKRFFDPLYRFIISCIAGFILGSFISSGTWETVISLMRFAAKGEMSIVSYLSSVLIPLLITALAVYYRKCYGVYIISFIKSFLYSFTGQLICNTFSYSGWLFRFMLLFTDTAVMFVILLLFLLKVKYRATPNKTLIIGSFSICTLIWILDNFLIAPYLAHTIN